MDALIASDTRTPTSEEMRTMPIDKIHVIRNESEAHRRVTKTWIVDMRRREVKHLQGYALDRIEKADAVFVERIKLASLAFVMRRQDNGKANAAAQSGADVEQAKAACRSLAAEVERLTAERDAARKVGADSMLHRAFYEAAQFILAESTFRRIREKARSLIASKVGS